MLSHPRSAGRPGDGWPQAVGGRPIGTRSHRHPRLRGVPGVSQSEIMHDFVVAGGLKQSHVVPESRNATETYMKEGRGGP